MKHSELAARLVVEGAIAAIAGTVRGQLPVKPTVLNDEQAQALNLPPGGTTLYYELDDKGVFFDSVGSRVAVWYSGADADRALGVLEAELKRHYPNTKQVIDAKHPDASGMRVRAYDVKIRDGLMATVEVSYSEPNVRPPKFSAQVVGMAIKN
jgi:hypothetical protein